jgi:hypothetical protein
MLSIASTQSNIASIKLYSGQYEEACVDLEEALLIQQCVLGDDHPLAQRTQESLMWMEQTRQSGSNLSLDILTRLAASMTIRGTDTKRDKADGVFTTLYSGIDAACQGWNRGAIANNAAAEIGLVQEKAQPTQQLSTT